MVERFHRTLKSAIASSQKDWLLALSSVMHGLRTLVNDSIHCGHRFLSPNQPQPLHLHKPLNPSSLDFNKSFRHSLPKSTLVFFPWILPFHCYEILRPFRHFLVAPMCGSELTVFALAWRHFTKVLIPCFFDKKKHLLYKHRMAHV